MAVQAYPATTSVVQGGSLDIRLNDDLGLGIDATMVVTDFATGAERPCNAGPDREAPILGWLAGSGYALDQVVAMTNLNGRLFCVTSYRTLWMRLRVLTEVDWTAIGTCPADVTGLAGYAGKLLASTAANELWWRDAVRSPV